jgi:hypothetical protein
MSQRQSSQKTFVPYEGRDEGRGPVPLFMVDIHLHRARLFGLSKDRPASYPWTAPQDDHAEARRLIEKHGYWRRKEELQDAEAAAHAVSGTP